MNTANASFTELVFWVTIIVGGTFTYFLPSLIAYKFRSNKTLMIVLVNVFFGWTIIGWVLPLFWALSHPTHTPQAH